MRTTQARELGPYQEGGAGGGGRGMEGVKPVVTQTEINTGLCFPGGPPFHLAWSRRKGLSASEILTKVSPTAPGISPS